MKKTELIQALAAETGESQAAAARSLDALVDIISKEVASGGEVAITGFGTFKGSARGERTGRNPRTGESMVISASKSVKFLPGAGLKAAMNASGEPAGAGDEPA